MPSINSAPTREELLNLFKSLVGIFGEFSLMLIAFIAAKYTDTGKSLFISRSHVMTALVVTMVLYFLVMILGTVIQLYIRNMVPILTYIILFLGSLASVLALSIISSTLALITAFSWICVFILIACYYRQEFSVLMSSAAERIKNLMH